MFESLRYQGYPETLPASSSWWVTLCDTNTAYSKAIGVSDSRYVMWLITEKGTTAQDGSVVVPGGSAPAFSTLVAVTLSLVLAVLVFLLEN